MISFIDLIKTWTDEKLSERYTVEAVVDFWKAEMINRELKKRIQKRAFSALAEALENFIETGYMILAAE
jgi:histone H3/H4